jgi:hypothetical protein
MNGYDPRTDEWIIDGTRVSRAEMEWLRMSATNFKQWAESKRGDRHAWDCGRTEPRDAGVTDPAVIVIHNWLMVDIETNPSCYAPKNPCYVKNHVNAPGTVRSWFRKMRAADWQRDTELEWLWSGGFTLQSDVDEHWTLFDTLKVVDRETAATYRVPEFTFNFNFTVSDQVPPGCIIIFDVELWRRWLQQKWDESVREVHGE